MAVGHETATESHTGTTGSAGEASFDISVPFTSSSKGLLVFTFVEGSSSDLATSVKIDPTGANTDVPAVSGGRAVDTAGEAGDCKAWFLGSGLPTTTTTVRVNRTNNAAVMYAVAVTLTGAGDLEAHTAGIVLLQEDGVYAEQSVTDGSPGSNSMRYAGGFSGLPNLASFTVGANSTGLHDIDLGAAVIRVVRETTAGQGSRSVGFDGSSDDRAAVHLAIKEAAAGTTVTPGVIARSFTVDAVTVKGSAVTAPGVIARSFTIPATTQKGSAVTQPATTARSFTIPATTQKGGAVTNPATTARSFTIPAVTVSAGGTPGLVTPGVIARSFTIPAVTVKGSASAAVAAIARSFSLDAVTAKGGAVTTPGAIARSFTIPATTQKGSAVTTPAVIPTTVSMPAVSVSTVAAVVFRWLEGALSIAAQTGRMILGRQEGSNRVDRQEGHIV